MTFKDEKAKAEYQRKLFLENVANLSDSYIKRIIRESAKKRGKTVIITKSMIYKKRSRLLKKRNLQKEIRLSGKKICKTCCESKKIDCFKRYGKECDACQNKRGWLARDKDKIRKRQKEEFLQSRVLLSNTYIARLIRSNMRNHGSFKQTEISQEFIDLKRKELLIKRKFKAHG